MDLYCVKCRTRTQTSDEREITTKNNRSALSGICVKCGTKKFRFISRSVAKNTVSGDLKKNEKPDTEVTSQPN